MKSKLLILLMLFVAFIPLFVNRVNAETRIVFDDVDGSDVVDGSEVSGSCEGIFTPEALELIDEILSYFRILAPAVLIVMCAVDLVQVVISSNEFPPGKPDASMHNALSKIARRCLAAIGLFLVPTIIQILLSLDGIKDTLQVDPNCGLSYNK